MSSFTFDDDAFMKIASDAVRQVAAQQTEDLDLLRHEYTGRPVDEIRPALQQLFARYDGQIIEPELSEWAQLIRDGVRIEITADEIDGSR
ncbi:hypothetical protein [Microbacterium paraoxydans]|uniref:hypothetical protein n=1 Tax=Microbacterium paraoxydans TaxID=199592 RepID=UPI0011A88F8F|nr:hypothetical protein [Microbacterium paraoxydans]